MDALFRFLASNEELIYIILAIAAFFNFRWLLRAWRERQDAVFGLERDLANQRLTVSVATLVVILALFLSELILVSFVVPMLPSTTLMGTPAVDGTLGAQVIPAFGTTPTAAVEEPPFGSVGCVSGELVITSPRPGQQVSAVVDLIGTVQVTNMGFYKLEVTTRGSNAWNTIFAGRDPKMEESLGIWDTRGLTPGDYDLRLVVVDSQGQELPPCIIPVNVAP